MEESRPATLILLLAGCALLGGCSGGGNPEFGKAPTDAKAQIEETKQSADLGHEPAVGEAEVPEPEMPPPAGEAEEAEAPVEPRDPTAPVHFETATIGEPEPPEPTLFEASQAERERRRLAQPAKLVITDANLHEYGQETELTELIVERAEGEETAQVQPPAEEGVRPDAENYWRTRMRDARLAWRAASDRIVELEGEVARLRYDFYSQDDAYYRDSEIKPAWDRAVVDLAQARLRVADLELAVRSALDEGAAEGALPGWLREGIDFEPETAEDDRRGRQELEPAMVVEPQVVEDPPR